MGSLKGVPLDRSTEGRCIAGPLVVVRVSCAPPFGLWIWVYSSFLLLL
ncbi:hypothetical protein SLEP1_g58363 [Rubroshorea leprosula]|uniref:Uncharacterized protein n=1 Tax=Rubroshorea leprosula TaxID=152421 RepID=A0AAV5MSC7_9ROSI|nr:hypothetical protein SLEP1_g58363 [Rubroshorea leprosula]